MGGIDSRGKRLNSVEVIGDSKCSLPHLPYGIFFQPQVILTNDHEILTCGGNGANSQKCLVLKEREWIDHSTLNQRRFFAASVTMPNGSYIFGGDSSSTTSEFLPNGSVEWQEGPRIPGSGFTRGCAILKSESEIILIGGRGEQNLLLDIETNEFTEISELEEPRFGHSCAVIEDQIVISGGFSIGSYMEPAISTEIISLHNALECMVNCTKSKQGMRRVLHGSAVGNVDGKQRLLAFGGGNLDSIEEWNPENESWTTLNNMKLSQRKGEFGYLSVPTNLLQCKPGRAYPRTQSIGPFLQLHTID